MNTELYFPIRRPNFTLRVLRSISQQRWAFAITFTTLLAAGVVVTRLLPPQFESTARVLIEYPRSTEQLIDKDADISRLDTVTEKASPVTNQAALLDSRPLFEKVLTRLKFDKDDPPKGKLTVKTVPGSDLIEVSYRSGSARLSNDILTALLAVYIDENLSLNREKGSSARIFLEKRLPELWTRLQKAQDNLESFQHANRFLGTTVETDSVTRSLGDLESDIGKARVELAFSDRKLADLKSQMPGSLKKAVSAAGLSQESGYQLLQTQLLQAEAQLADLQSRFGPQNPQVLNAIQKHDQLRQLLKERTANLAGSASAGVADSPMDPLRQRLVEQWVGLELDRAAQAARLSQLTGQYEQLQQRSARLPQLIKQQTQLQMIADAARQEYLEFKQKYTDSRIAEQQKISNVRIIEPPQLNLDPVWPNRKLLFALVIVGSTGIGLLVVWLRQRNSDTLDGLIELREALPLPILALVPWLGNGLIATEERIDQRPLADSYRLLQAHLRMFPSRQQILSICSWSTLEGCSSVAANLALLEAKAGRRVLLIDADGRFPGQPEFWNFQRPELALRAPNEPLIWRSYIQKAQPDLYVLPFGHIRPSESYKDWVALLEQVREEYDLVLVDCPPLLHGPDATLLASITDGVLWVSCPQRLGRRQAIACSENLRTWATRLLGQVVIGSDANLPGTLPVRSTQWLPREAETSGRWLPNAPSGENRP